eukprot:gene26176-28608_t
MDTGQQFCDAVPTRDACVTALLRQAGLRPTRQRIGLVSLLYGRGARHVTAEGLFEEASAAGILISLATVYNALHQFTDARLLREVAVDGAKSYFDTNVSDHHHFFIEGAGRMIDIPVSSVAFEALPEPPEGYEISRLDVVVRLRRKG